MIEKLIVIDLEPHHQKERLIKRDNLSHETAQIIIDSQPSRESRLAMADWVINNNQGLESFKRELGAKILNLLF